MQISNITDTSIKTSRSIHSHGKRLYVHMFDMIDTALSYWRALVVSNFFRNLEVKESSLYVIWHAHTAFLLSFHAIISVTHSTCAWLDFFFHNISRHRIIILSLFGIGWLRRGKARGSIARHENDFSLKNNNLKKKNYILEKKKNLNGSVKITKMSLKRVEN